MRNRCVLLALVVALVSMAGCRCNGTSGCNDDDDCPAAQRCVEGNCVVGDPPLDAAGDADSASGLDSATGADSAAPPDAGPATDAGAASFGADVVAFDPWANCQPLVGPDPMLFTATIRYTNWDAASAATATVTTAELSILTASGPAMLQTVSLTPADSGPVPPGSYADVMHSKVIDSGTPPLAVCTMCDNGTAFDARLTVTFDVAGSPVTATSPVAPVLCAF